MAAQIIDTWSPALEKWNHSGYIYGMQSVCFFVSIYLVVMLLWLASGDCDCPLWVHEEWTDAYDL